MLTAIVPIKANSERLEAKNLQYFVDGPLYLHKLHQLRYTNFNKIVVSSESNDVLKVAEELHYVPHKRDPKYSTSDVPMSDVFKYIASEVYGDDIAWINVTNPLVSQDKYNEAIKLWRERKGHDCLLSVYNLQKYLIKDKKPLNWTPSRHPKSQDMEGLFALSFAINIRKRQDVINEGHFIGYNPLMFVMDKYTSTKIDYQEDLDFCRTLWHKKY